MEARLGTLPKVVNQPACGCERLCILALGMARLGGWVKMKTLGTAAIAFFATLLFGATLSAQATASTGIQNYGTSGNWLDEYYFDVDFGAGVASCDLAIDLSHTAALSGGFDMWLTDALTGLPLATDVQKYDIGIGYGTTTPAAPPGTGGPVVIWGPNSILGAPLQGNHPLTGIVRFNFTVLVRSTSTFPNDINVTWTTTAGTIIPNTGFPIPTGTNLGYNVWTQVAATTPGILGGYGRAGDSDYFQRNHSNVSWGTARFGNASDQLQFYIDFDLGSASTTYSVGISNFAYQQPGTATGTCIAELYDMAVGFSTPVATATCSTASIGLAGAGYGTYTTSTARTGLQRFRVVVRGQNLQNVAYGATTFADFGWNVYFPRAGQLGAVTNEPVIAPPRMSITPASGTLTNGQTLVASGGTPTVNYAWSVVSGTTATINPTTGQVTTTGNGTVTIRVTNGTTGEFAEGTYTTGTGGGGGGPLDITGPASLPNGTVGTAYPNTTMTATGGTPPYTWSDGGTLPPGLSIAASTGVISGTPTTPGNYSPVTISVSDSAAGSDNATYNVQIVAAGGLIILTTTLNNGTVGTGYSQTINASGGTGPYSWTVSAGALPTGLTLGSSTSTSVAITGTPTVANTFNFTVQITDSTPTSDTQDFTVTIASGGGGGGGGGISKGGGGGGGCSNGGSHSAWLMLGLAPLALLVLRKRRSA